MNNFINVYKNVFTPQVTDQIDVYEFFDRIKNPSESVLRNIELARQLFDSGENGDYNVVKTLLPCFTLNFEFKDRKSNKNIIGPTGFIYLDVDSNDGVDITHPLVFSAWKSLSQRGWGLLVKVEGLSLQNFKSTYTSIAEALNFPVDLNAGKATQYCIHSYDKKLYVNDNSLLYKATLAGMEEGRINSPKGEHINTPSTSVSINSKRRVTQAVGVNQPLRHHNLDETEFNGSDYLVYFKRKHQYARLYVPQIIYTGSRNNVLYLIGYQLRALNPWIGEARFSSLLHGLNEKACEIPLPEKEVDRLVFNILSIEEDELQPILNAECRLVFNPESKLSKSLRRTITNGVLGQIKSNRTINELQKVVKKWDSKANGKLTQKKLATVSGKNIKTVEKYYRRLDFQCNRLSGPDDCAEQAPN